MKVMKKVLTGFLALASIISLTGCEKKNEDALKFKEEYEKINGVNNGKFEYRTITVDEKNPFVYITPEDLLTKIDSNETFFVYFGDEHCPWCRSVIEEATKSAIENKVDKIYYVKIWEDFHEEVLRDTYKLNDKNEPELSAKGTDAYYKLLDKLGNVLSDYNLSYTDDAGKTVKVSTGEKRIFAPNYIFVKNCKAEKLIEGISDKQTKHDAELTDEIRSEQKAMFDEFFKLK